MYLESGIKLATLYVFGLKYGTQNVPWYLSLKLLEASRRTLGGV